MNNRATLPSVCTGYRDLPAGQDAEDRADNLVHRCVVRLLQLTIVFFLEGLSVTIDEIKFD